jgi:hypothetical protein
VRLFGGNNFQIKRDDTGGRLGVAWVRAGEAKQSKGNFQVFFEPMMSVFWSATNDSCRNIARNVQQPLGFGTGFVAASVEAV